MSRFDQLIRNLRKAITEKDDGPKGYDTVATVKAVKDGTAWVHIPNGYSETPAQFGVDVKPGDKVMVRIGNNRAKVIGNLTAPPTDDKLAAEAHMQAKLAYNKAVKADEKVDEVDEKVVLVDEKAGDAMASANGKNTIYHSATAPTGGTYKTGDTWFDTDDDNKIYKWNGSAWSPVLLGDDAIDSISANKITAGEIDASQITVSNLDAGNITSGTLDTARLNVSGIITSGNIATESDLPTKVSDLTNDSGFQNASQVDSIVTGKGYQTASQVNTAVSNGVSGKADKTDAILEQQRIYKSVASGGSASATTTWVTETGDVNNTWTTKRPTYSSSYPVLYTAIQRKKVSGTVSCTTPLKDDTLTVIDGGHITTGTIDANRINLTQAIQIGNIATGDDIPTNISDLNNDVGFMTDGSFGNLVKTPLFTDVAATLFSALNYNSKYLRYNSAGGWTKLSSNICATYDSGTGLCKFDGRGSLGSGTADFRQALPLKQNTDYTVSMQVGSTFRFNFMGYTYISKSGWSIDGDRIYRTFNTGDNTYHMFTIEASDSRPVYINRIKVEEGSTYSGWSDYDETIGKNYETQLDTSDRLTDASNTFATNKADAAEQNAKDYADSVAGGYKNYLKFDTTTGLDVGYTDYDAKVNIKGDGVRLYNNSGNVGTYIRNDGMTVYDGLGGSSPTPIFYVYANSDWSSYAKSGNATFQSALSPAPYKAEISCSGTVVGIGRVWAQNRQGTDISDYCFWNYDSRSNKMQVYISQDYSGPTPAIAYADYWVQTPARAYVGVNPSNPSNYLFVVGNGTASHPSNALSVDGFGNLAAKGYANFDRGVVASTSIGSRSYADWDVYFNKTFESVPIVVATLCSSSTAYQIGNVSCSVLANSITKNKFTLRMFNADTTSRSPAVYWMATDAK